MNYLREFCLTPKCKRVVVMNCKFSVIYKCSSNEPGLAIKNSTWDCHPPSLVETLFLFVLTRDLLLSRTMKHG